MGTDAELRSRTQSLTFTLKLCFNLYSLRKYPISFHGTAAGLYLRQNSVFSL